MTDPHPRGRETNHALTEVRTVLKRSETALLLLYNLQGVRDGRLFESDFWREYYADAIADPDLDDMIAALEEAQRQTKRWRRTGRPRKGGAK